MKGLTPVTKGASRLLTSRLFIRLLYHLTGAYSRTWRLRVENEKLWLDHLAGGGRVLLCAWHQQFFGFIRRFRRYRHHRPSLMISQSRDGELIAGVAALTGWQAVRGSSSRDGRRALGEMVAHLRGSRLAAHVVDGPRGPAGVVKSGVIRLAQSAGALIVPVYLEAPQAWYARSWDRFCVPKPFSRVTIRFGDPLTLPPGTDGPTVGAQRQRLEAIMRPGLQGAGSQEA
jgi:lysophospholipid acyltransferase (LPLAT)-like uncharacterized protein